METQSLVMCTNKNGDTPLLTAARCGQLGPLETLYTEHGVSLEHTNADGKTALHEAAQGGHLECVRFLIRAGAHVDSLKKADWTPLMLACTKQNLAVVEELVKGGASLSLVNKDGWTPFHIACREGHSDIIEFLLDTSPGCWDTVSRNGRTQLHTAALHGKLETVRILLDRCGCKPDSVDSSGVTPLMDAAQGNHQEVAQCLLHHHKGCLKMEDSQGRQAIHHASQAGATDALQLLLTEGAEVDALASVTGLTPLHYAAKEGHAGALSQLLTQGADPSLTDKTGKTALDIAQHARDSQAAVAVLEEAHGNQNHVQTPRTTVSYLSPPQDFRQELEHDIKLGFAAQPKSIPPKYHYDEIGSALFEDITRLPEYYLTRAETEILTERAKDIMQLVVPDELVELGSGSSTKTRLLLEAMHSTGGNKYVPLEISETALRQAAEALSADYKWLEIEGHIGNYYSDLPRLKRKGRRLLTFLGSSLGNCTPNFRREFLQQLGTVLKEGDALLLGVDLVKDVETMELAYNDSAGVTARFCTNMLVMLNRELDANFEVQHFTHAPCWNPENSSVESWIRADQDMTISIRAIDMTFKLTQGEKIFTEISCKFTREGIEQELSDAGMKVVEWYTDSAARYGVMVACPK
jgi:L-histidine N-alpha-methyltransferase